MHSYYADLNTFDAESLARPKDAVTQVNNKRAQTSFWLFKYITSCFAWKMRKLLSKWVPRLLTVNAKQQYVDNSKSDVIFRKQNELFALVCNEQN